MESSGVHRKIELQAPEDFTYLIDNVRRAAADSINAAFPPVEGADGQEDELRVRIEEMVNDYIIQTFTLATPNLTINGLSIDPSHYFSPTSAPLEPQIQYELFDPRKRERIEDLAREEEDLLRSIAALKRRVPAATATNWAVASKAGVAADEAALASVTARVEEDGATSGRKTLEGMRPMDRQGKVEVAFAGVVETLVRLKREMPATVAKMERARVAAGYIATEL
ncbi:hypothetical protein B0T25DRAFT_287630 [Lasiosphaeria hispida]|uniref:Kinetochore protein mis14 n=1 Tax=Lasiosphaeria hispida TaxID=260671 RepID=A0AAJ0HBY9_9PEZI|nr:hypothetical protein B0T25DRAFT_287630 [Lasiosphaeria hispida]